MSDGCAPVVYLIFNRPDLTEMSFEAIRQARPGALYVVADGPRADQPGEAELCAAARAVTERVDWPCEVIRDYSDVNLGCGLRVSSGITNAIKVFEEAIILEDDCLPDSSFFPFCAELLNRYRDDERVMAISGNNFQGGQRRTPYSYYFSKYMHCWGWATWRRAWAYYDYSMENYNQPSDRHQLHNIRLDDEEARFWKRLFDLAAQGRANTWDYQWQYACWKHGGLSIVPELNLVTNCGFRADATHTRNNSSQANMRSETLDSIIVNPDVIQHVEADRYVFRHVFTTPQTNQASWQRRLLARFASRIRLLTSKMPRPEGG